MTLKRGEALESVGEERRGVAMRLAERVNPVLAPMGLVFRRISAFVERDTGIGAQRWFVLVILDERGGQSQVELCRFLGIDPSRMSRLARAMEVEGLVFRERASGDGRVVSVHLSDEGRALLEELPAHREKVEARAREILGEDSMQRLRSDLYTLAEGLEEQ